MSYKRFIRFYLKNDLKVGHYINPYINKRKSYDSIMF